MFVDFNVEQGEWFYFQDSTIKEDGTIEWGEPYKDAKVQIRSLGSFFEERLGKRKRAVDHVLNPQTKNMERISYFVDISVEEAKAERDDAFDYAIVGLSGFKDKKTGEEIECTRENKLKLMKIPAFDRFFVKCQDLITSSGIKLTEELQKNL